MRNPIYLPPASVVKPYLSENIMSSFPIPEAHSVITTVLVYRKDHFINYALQVFLNIIRS